MVGDGDAAAVVCSDRILDYFARPDGLPRLEGRRVSGGAWEVGSNLGPEELEALNGPLRGLADGILAQGVAGLRGPALYVNTLLAHPMRVSRAALSRRPLRMTSSLGKLVFAAMAALVLALLSEEPWVLGVEINIRRSILVAVAVLLAANACVVFQSSRLPSWSPRAYARAIWSRIGWEKTK